MKCKHTFKKFTTRGGYLFDTKEMTSPLVVIDRCVHCYKEREREPTQQERDKNYQGALNTEQTNGPFLEILDLIEGKTGYELMELAEQIAKQYPEHVHIANIDDSVHSNSLLMFVEHRCDKYYNGTSVFVIPQCSGEKPLRFFMYEEQLKSVLNCFAKIQRHPLPNDPYEAE